MLIDKQIHKEALAELWHKVFGDNYSYINLIFRDEYSDSIICFGETEGDKVVSAFYLLKNTLKLEGRVYKGYYLYAAATLASHRGKGIMGRLINEAQLYCKNEGADFISLVPSQKSLYSYYQRFGFESAMYCYFNSENPGNLIKIDGEEYYAFRSDIVADYVNFERNAFSYAINCFNEVGTGFYKDSSNDRYFCIDDENYVIEELSSDSLFSKEKKPFGMIYPINNELLRNWNYTDIYMNIALD